MFLRSDTTYNLSLFTIKKSECLFNTLNVCGDENVFFKNFGIILKEKLVCVFVVFRFFRILKKIIPPLKWLTWVFHELNFGGCRSSWIFSATSKLIFSLIQIKKEFLHFNVMKVSIHLLDLEVKFSVFFLLKVRNKVHTRLD